MTLYEPYSIQARGKKKLSKTDVLIVGYRGTGKTTLARWLGRYLSEEYQIVDGPLYIDPDIRGVVIHLKGRAPRNHKERVLVRSLVQQAKENPSVRLIRCPCRPIHVAVRELLRMIQS